MTPPVDLVEIVRTAKDVLWPSGLFLGIALWGYGVVPKPGTHLRVQVRTPGKKTSMPQSVNLLKHAVEKDGGQWQPTRKNMFKGSKNA